MYGTGAHGQLTFAQLVAFDPDTVEPPTRPFEAEIAKIGPQDGTITET